MIDPGRTSRSAEEGPGRREFSTGALAFPGEEGTLGERRSRLYALCGFRSNQAKGAQKVDGSAPLLPLPRNPGISNSDDEIAAGLGRKP
jgi:hypothetical protein